MHRFPSPPRIDWPAKVEKWGLTYHTHEGKPYWFESAYYQFTAEDVETLENATNELSDMCLAAVQHVIDNNRFAELSIPENVAAVIRKVWDDDPPAIYGRFDLGFDGTNPPKLFEYNADTPTTLLEAAVVQWHWLQDMVPDGDQFNSIWEGLVEKWKALKDEGAIKGKIVHFAHEPHAEDMMTATVMRDTAIEAGLNTDGLHMKDIGWNSGRKCFVDLQERPIETIFKLYPWEWMVFERFGERALENMDQTQWIEPVWKMVLSNKGILAILWEMYPGHPNLLPTYFGRSHDLVDYVRKPLLSREGANVMMKADGTIVRTPGKYGDEGYVFQDLYRLPDFDGNRPVIGSWVIDCVARGIGVRESDGPVTDDFARFVPHLIG